MAQACGQQGFLIPVIGKPYLLFGFPMIAHDDFVGIEVDEEEAPLTWIEYEELLSGFVLLRR